MNYHRYPGEVVEKDHSAFLNTNIKRWCALCDENKPQGGGHMRNVLGGRHWVCGDHTKSESEKHHITCPHCNQKEKSAVKETRLMGGDVVRRRQCTACGEHFGTRERVDPDLKMTRRKLETPKAKPTKSLFGGVWK